MMTAGAGRFDGSYHVPLSITPSSVLMVTRCAADTRWRRQERHEQNDQADDDAGRFVNGS